MLNLDSNIRYWCKIEANTNYYIILVMFYIIVIYPDINLKFYPLLYKIIVFNFLFHKDRSYQIQ